MVTNTKYFFLNVEPSDIHLNAELYSSVCVMGKPVHVGSRVMSVMCFVCVFISVRDRAEEEVNVPFGIWEKYSCFRRNILRFHLRCFSHNKHIREMRDLHDPVSFNTSYSVKKEGERAISLND